MFKGKRSASRVASNHRCHDIKVIRDPDDPKKQIFPPNGFVLDARAGLIHPRQMIFDTGCPLPGIFNLGSMIYSGRELPLRRIRKSLTVTTLVASINDFLNRDVHRKKPALISISDIRSLRVCEHDPCIWLIEFKGRGSKIHPVVNEIIGLVDEGDGGNQGSKNEGAGVVNAINFFDLRQELKDLRRELEKVGKGKIKGKNYEMAVAVVDRGPFMVDAVANEYSHATVIGEIIEFDGYVKAIACPMVSDYKANATIFDMICALRNCSIIDMVQVINISQGFYSQLPHPVLHKVLKGIDKPVVCSAGNDDQDNDINPHWPSNFSMELDHVFSVASVSGDGIFTNISNHGLKSVILAARGEWGNGSIVGTSYAAAWMSRMIALSYSIKGRVDLNLSDVEFIIDHETNHQVDINVNDQTVTKVRFLP
jgi:hypothetical protein